MAVTFEVPKSGDGVERLIDGINTSASELPQALPVLQPSNHVFDTGADASMSSPGVVSDDASVRASSWCFDVGKALVTAIAEQAAVVVQIEFSSRDDDVVAVAGPCRAHRCDGPVDSGDDNLSVDRTAVVFRGGGEALIMNRHQSAVDDVHGCVDGCAAVRAEQSREAGCQVVNDPVHAGLTGSKQCCEGAGGEVGAELNEHKQQPGWQCQTPGSTSRGWPTQIRKQRLKLGSGQPGERQQIAPTHFQGERVVGV